ncbi:phosphohydrolase, partial [[Clostridium] symbiosum]
MDILDDLLMKMISYNSGDPKRIQHLIKVHSFARLIG